MTDSEVKSLIVSILSRSTPEAGFLGADVVSDYDHDGEPILRVTAHYRRRPSVRPDPLINAVHPIRAALIERGDERAILLTNDVETERLADAELLQEDVD